MLHVVETEVHSVRLSYALFRRGPDAPGRARARSWPRTWSRPSGARLLDAVGDPGLAAELDRIRVAGYVVTRGELDDGAAAVAAPILDRRGRLVAGLSIAGPAERITGDVDAMTAAVTAAARKIERAHHGG